MVAAIANHMALLRVHYISSKFERQREEVLLQAYMILMAGCSKGV